MAAMSVSLKLHSLPARLSSPPNFPSSRTAAFALPARSHPRKMLKGLKIVCDAIGSVGGQTSNEDENPYQVLGVNPFEKFDMIKASYTRKHKDAERSGDEATMARLERAYDKIMMGQLANRKKGVTFGSFEVSKDIRYADKLPLVPWGPRFAPCARNDILINLGISAAFVAWIISAHTAQWKPLQFLVFGYIWRLFNKLGEYEPAPSSFESEEGDEKKRSKSGKRLLRTLGLVFSCVALCSLAFTGVLNLYELLGRLIPRALVSSQELVITISSAISLFFMGSYYR